MQHLARRCQANVAKMQHLARCKKLVLLGILHNFLFFLAPIFARDNRSALNITDTELKAIATLDRGRQRHDGESAMSAGRGVQGDDICAKAAS
jgi:hypothetical protein